MSDPVKNRRRGYTRISPKHQVTIPVDALRQAGLESGDELRAYSDGRGKIVLVRVDDVVERYAGALTGLWPHGWLRELRDEWR